MTGIFKRWPWVLGGSLFALAALIWSRPSAAAYHLREFERVKTNFNNFLPSISDRSKGIRSNQDKWDFHLENLVRLGAVLHREFIFTEVPYTKEAARLIYRAALSNFPSAVMFSAKDIQPNAPGYGVTPYILEVWDVPEQMDRWTNFFEANRHKQ